MRGAKAAAVAEATFSTVGVKSFSRAERVESVDLAVSSLRRGATHPPAKRSVHYRGHTTGGPPLRDGHLQLSHRIKKNRERARVANRTWPLGELLHALSCCVAERRNPLLRFVVPRSANHDNIDYAATFGTT